jgi:hypothetical protein
VEDSRRVSVLSGFLPWALVLALVGLDASLRAGRALDRPAFDAGEPASVLQSDPAVLARLVGGVLESGGPLPEVDRWIEYPNSVDVASTYTVGLEWILLAADRAMGGEVPLHVLSVWVCSALAAAAGIGLALAAWCLTRSPWAALLAAALHAVLPVTHRTVGFVLVREDLSVPLYALHLAALVAALGSASRKRWILAGLSAGAALATWHGMGVFLLIEGVALSIVVAWRRTRDPAAWWGSLGLTGMTMLVPALLAKGGPLALAPALVIAVGVVIRWPQIAWVRAALLLAVSVSITALNPARADMAHVAELLWAKIRHLGVQPNDPSGLPDSVRMMWQGPFATVGAATAWRLLQGGLLILPFVVVGALRRRRQVEALGLFLLLSLPAAWLVQRVTVLPGLLLCVLLPVLVTGWAAQGRAGLRWGVLFALVLGQGLLSERQARAHPTGWLDLEGARARLALIEAVDERVPRFEPIAADFMLGPLLLYATGHPVPLSPKWERKASRERVLRTWEVLHHGTLEEWITHQTQDLQCRYLVVDERLLLGTPASRWMAGIPFSESAVRPGSALEALVGADPPAAYELLWRRESLLGDLLLLRLR